jgi:hypothetical protein
MTMTVEQSIKHFLGYGLSMKSQKRWAEIEEHERQRAEIIAHARNMIEWAETEYQIALARTRGDMKTTTILTLKWSPERVLTTHKDFIKLCRALNNDKVWSMLTRQERKFIAGAVEKKRQL